MSAPEPKLGPRIGFCSRWAKSSPDQFRDGKGGQKRLLRGTGIPLFFGLPIRHTLIPQILDEFTTLSAVILWGISR